MTLIDSYPALLTALCIWREARGECRDAKRGVAHVIRNRAARKFRGKNVVEVILWHAQFSSFNPDDPNAVKFPTASDAAFAECCDVVANPGDDPTRGALYYHSCPTPPSWAEAGRLTTRIGAFSFYR